MIRVAVIMAAIAQAPMLGLLSVAHAQPPKKVSDSYYAKRAQAKTEAAAGIDAVASGVANFDPTAGGAYQTGQGVMAVGQAGAGMFPRQGPMDPYYAARQAAAMGQETPVNMFDPNFDPNSAEPTNYDDEEIDETGATEPVVDGPVQDGVEQIYPGDANVTGQPGAGFLDNYNEYVDYGAPVGPTSILWDEIHSCRTFWVNAEYLAFGLKGNHVPALVTTSVAGTPQGTAGVLGQPNTRVMFGDDRILTGIRSGGRITVGGWIVGDTVGIEANYFALGRGTTEFNAAGNFSGGGTGPILARPFVAPPNVPSRLMLAFPNFILGNGAPANLDGTVNVRANSDVQSAGLGFKRMVAIDFQRDKRMFLVGGYRFFRLDEDLTISDRITTNLTQLPITGVTTNWDQFSTTNQFHGGDFGLQSDIRRGPWVLESTFKVALGNMRQYTDINGNTTITTGGVTTVFPGGLLAQRSNIGHYTRNQFAAIPEVNLKLGLQLSCKWRATVGYNFQWISRVARPGNEIDTLVSIPPNPGGLQAVQTPVYLNNPTSIWMQGATAGLEYRF